MRDVEEQNVPFDAGMFTLNEDGDLVVDSESLREAVAAAAEYTPEPQPYSSKIIAIY